MRIIPIDTDVWEETSDKDPRKDLLVTAKVEPDGSDGELARFYHSNPDGSPIIEIFNFSRRGITINEELDPSLLPEAFPLNRDTGGIVVMCDGGILLPVDETAIEAQIEREIARMMKIRLRE